MSDPLDVPPPLPPSTPPEQETARDSLRSPAGMIGLFLTLALYLIPLRVALLPVTDWDIWWHLRTGQWIIEHGTVPTTDPFSAGIPAQPWLAYSWLFAVLVHGLHEVWGLQGILALRVLLVLALTAAIHHLVRRREPNDFRASGLTACVLIALSPLLTERPWLFSMLFFVLTLEGILTLREGRPGWVIWLLPGVYCLWANLHIQFAYGLFLLGLSCAASLLECGGVLFLAETRCERIEPSTWRRLLALTAVCSAATLINPYGWRLHALVLELASLTAAFQWISELQAMTFRELPDWMVLGLFGAAAYGVGRRGQFSTWEVLLLTFGASLSFRARRDVWVVALASAAILSTWKPRREFATDRSKGSVHLALLSLICVIGLTGLLGWRRDLSEKHLEAEVAARFPLRAVQWVEQKGYPGPLYNHFDWGGYLIWDLPRLRVAIDGRADVHRDDRLRRSLATWEGRPGWHEDPDLSAARLVIAAADSPLGALLRQDARFELVYEDPVARVFVARLPQDSP